MNIKSTDLDRNFISPRYKPVQEGGLVNHFQFYLAYLGVTIGCIFGLLVAVINADKIDAFFSEVIKMLFL